MRTYFVFKFWDFESVAECIENVDPPLGFIRIC